MTNRQSYFSDIEAFREKKVIKVLTGLRRCGKSFLMEQFIEKLRSENIPNEQIIYYRLDDLENEPLLDYKVLHETIKSRLAADKMTYIFLDEIQLCPNFQKAVDSLYNKKNTDIYITGSNSDLLSGELATLLSGRYITIDMQPFSFQEYLHERAEQSLLTDDIEQCYLDYVRYGSLPFTVQLKNNERDINQYLNGVYKAVLQGISQQHQINDLSVLESVIRFMFANTANICTSKKISDTLTSGGRKVSQPTTENYMHYLEECFMVYKVGRYDIKGKEYLKTLSKYYIADTGLRNMLLGYRNIDTGHILETLVFLELKRRKYELYTGKIGDMEIDFVAKTQRGIKYIQVAESVKDSETLAREIKPFKKLPDSYPCFLITLDKTPNEDFEGVRHINALDFLQGKNI